MFTEPLPSNGHVRWLQNSCSQQTCDSIFTLSLKARVVEPEISISRQWVSKHIPIGTGTHATIMELLKKVISVLSVPKFYGYDQQNQDDVAWNWSLKAPRAVRQ
jgi:hypothetical protein